MSSLQKVAAVANPAFWTTRPKPVQYLNTVFDDVVKRNLPDEKPDTSDDVLNTYIFINVLMRIQ